MMLLCELLCILYVDAECTAVVAYRVEYVNFDHATQVSD